MAQRGRISEWNDERGYGFITPAGGDRRVFVHISAVADRTKRPAVADLVSYELGRDARGRPRASNVAYVGSSRGRRRRAPWSAVQVVVAVALTIAAGMLAYRSSIFIEAILLYLVASSVTFLVYVFDKSAAVKGAWRTSESTLHVLSLIGGWPGAFADQRYVRHKSRKPSFQIVFWLTVAVNLIVVAWLGSPHGSAMLEKLFSAI